MAKAYPIGSLDCDAAAAEMAATVLRARFYEMAGYQGKAAMPDDAEGVHDMRVASRRFRSVVRDFAHLFDRNNLERLKKDCRKLADALGAVRDLDVAVAALDGLRGSEPGDAIAAGLTALISQRLDSRSASYRTLLRLFSPTAVSRREEDLSKALQGLTGRPDESFRHAGRKVLRKSLDDFLDRTDALYDPFNIKALHKLRIRAKRLRYSLELFDQCRDGELLHFAKKIKKMQSCLGMVHDCDAWIGQIEAEITAGSIDRATAEWLISEFLNRRTDEYTQALALWNDWNCEGLTKELSAIIEK